ncbi:MAG TPA: hypothetical protein VFO98_01260 [Marmoricola sp.]|nr:hypothetical protein [Marmoricola sp.]
MSAGPQPGTARALLVTCTALPEGEPGGELLVEALARRGVGARWVIWDDPSVDWSDGLVCVRATWDYDTRRDQFLAWARSVPRLLNSAEVFAWNTDKEYLAGLGEDGLSVVPTICVDGEEELPAAIAETSTTPDGAGGAVVKPRVGAGGRGVTLFDMADGGPAALDESGLGAGPWIVQPLVDSVRTDGETSVYVLDGAVTAQFVKRPAAGDIRVHEQYGGRTTMVEVTVEAAELAARAVGAAEEQLGERLDYARVDCLRLADGTLAVSEIEVTEPGLYLEVAPTNVEPFADLVASRLHRPR